MKFPISRESLQTFTREKYYKEMDKEMIEKQINVDLNKFRKDFKNHMTNNMTAFIVEKKFVWGFANHIISHMIGGNKITKDEYLDMFIEKLKELFIGCDFIIDPLKTYMIIDWS